jgi:hypothetical protein
MPITTWPSTPLKAIAAPGSYHTCRCIEDRGVTVAEEYSRLKVGSIMVAESTDADTIWSKR